MKNIICIVGSSADDSLGVGTLLVGTEYERTSEGWRLATQSGWVDCYDIMVHYDDGTTDSPTE